MKKKIVFVALSATLLPISSAALADTIRFDIVDDTYITGSTIIGPDDLNYGGNVYLNAYRNSHYWGNLLLQASDIFGGDTDQVSYGTSIVSAELHLWLDISWGAETNTFNLYQLITAWEEDTVTASNFGTVSANAGSSPVASLAGPTSNPYGTNTEYVFDVTSSLIDWQSGTANYGWGLTASSARNQFFSSDFTNESLRPFLSIQTEDTTPVPEPEPSTLLLFGSGIAVLIGLRVARKKTLFKPPLGL